MNYTENNRNQIGTFLANDNESQEMTSLNNQDNNNTNSNSNSQQQQQQYEKELKQKQKVLMNQLLFSYEGEEEDDDNEGEDQALSEEMEHNLGQQPQMKQNSSQKDEKKVKYRSKTASRKGKKGRSASLDKVKSATNSPENLEKVQFHTRRASQQLNTSTYPKITFDMNFELEVKNDGDIIPHSEHDLSVDQEDGQEAIEEGGIEGREDEEEEHNNKNNQHKDEIDMEENNASFQDELENSQIESLKKKQSKKIFHSSDSSSSCDEKQEHLLTGFSIKKQDSLIRHNIKETVEYLLGLVREHNQQSTPNRIFSNNTNEQRVKYLDAINILFFYQYFQFKNQKENAESVQDFVESNLQQTYQFTLKKEIVARVLNSENQNYVKIIYEGNYTIENQLSVDFLQIFQSNFSATKFQNKLTINAPIMIFYYSVEFLSPKMIRYLVTLVEDTSVLKQILSYFILYHLNSHAKEAFQKLLTKKEEMENEIIQLCFQSSNFYFLFHYYNTTKVKITGWLEDGDYQKMLIKALGRSTGINFQAVLYFMRKVQLWSKKNLIHLMAETFSERLDASNNDTHFLFTFSNPLKILVLILEVLTKTYKHEVLHKNIVERTVVKYNNFATVLIKSTNDEELMHSILVDWDLEGRTLLYIIYENSLHDVLNEVNIQDVIEIIWNGNANSTVNIISQFSICQNLFFSHPNKFQKDKEKLHFSLQKSYQKEDFLGRKSIWINQIKLRYFFDQIQIFFIMAFLLTYFLQMYSIFTGGFMPINNDPEVVDSTIQQIQDNLSQWIYVHIFIGLNFPMNSISSLVFLKQFEKNAFFTQMQIFDLFFGLVIYVYIAFIYSMQNFSYDDVQFIMVFLLNLMAALSTLRIIFCLTVTKTFGPVFQACSVIITEVSKFMTLFITFLLLFTVLGLVLFQGMPAGKFSSFTTALNFLIEAMFAQFQFQMFSFFQPALGYIFMLAYLYSFGIVLTNAMVAILTLNFEMKNRKSKMLYYQHTIFHIRQGNYIQKHGCLVTLPLSLEFTVIPYLILKQIFSSKSSFMKAVQKFYIALSYMPVLLISLLSCLIINLFLLPVGYFAHLFALSKQAFKGTVSATIVFKWFILGIFIMLKQTLTEDLKEFLKYMCEEQSCHDKEHIQSKKIVYDSTLRQVFQTVCNMYVSGITYCTLSELFNQIKEDFSNQSKFVGKESCVDEKYIEGVHLLRRRNIPSNSPNLEQINLRKKTSSTPLQLHLLQRKNSATANSTQKIDKINIKTIFQGIKQLENEIEYIFEYFQRFCFKDIVRNEEQRDQVLNLHNILKLHEQFTTTQLKVAIHSQLFTTVKLT